MAEERSVEDQAPQSQEPESASKPAPETSAEAAVAVDPLEAAKAEALKFKDQLLRTAADFDNFRKRTRRELQDAERRAREELLRDLLPVFDNLERAAQHASSVTDVKTLSDGISMVLRLFGDTISKIGVVRISAQGEAFDPALHEAVQQFETSDQAPGTVVAEIQPGYRFGDRLIRPAMVVVAKPKSS